MYVVGITATVELTLGLLDISLTIPTELRGARYTAMGLFGNNDGDPGNDFTLPNGTILADSLTERQIFGYGEHCKYWKKISVLLQFFCVWDSFQKWKSLFSKTKEK